MMFKIKGTMFIKLFSKNEQGINNFSLNYLIVMFIPYLSLKL